MTVQLTIVDGEMTEPSAVHVCHINDLPVGLGRAYEVGGRMLALFRTRGGKVFATDQRCPHKGGPLAEGMLAGDAVVCPLHAFRFDFQSGACDQANVCAVKTYAVEVREDQVFLHLA